MSRMLRFINVLLVLLTLFAGPYRVLAFKFRTFGRIGLGLVTWVGIGIAFPACIVAFSSEEPYSIEFWIALAVWGYVQMFAKWCSKNPPRDPFVQHCWIGKWEPLLALAVSGGAGLLCGEGGFVFFMIGYGCSVAEIRLRRLRRRLDAWTSRDTERLLSPVVAAAAWIKRMSPVCGAFIAHYGLILISAFGTTLRKLGAFLAKRAQERAAVRQAAPVQFAVPPHYRQRQGFFGRVMVFLVGHTIYNAIIGVLGFNIIAIPFAIILWLLGWHVEVPWHVKQKATEFAHSVKGKFTEERDELVERLREEKEELAERLRNKGEALRERLDDSKEEISAEVGRKARSAMWGAMWK